MVFGKLNLGAVPWMIRSVCCHWEFVPRTNSNSKRMKSTSERRGGTRVSRSMLLNGDPRFLVCKYWNQEQANPQGKKPTSKEQAHTGIMSKIRVQTQGCAVVTKCVQPYVWSRATVFLLIVPIRCGQEQKLKKVYGSACQSSAIGQNRVNGKNIQFSNRKYWSFF